MPIYDYRCDDCKKTYDVFHKVRELTEDIVCPSCGSRKHTRLLSAPMVMAGSGSDAGSESDFGGECPNPGGCSGGTCGLN